MPKKYSILVCKGPECGGKRASSEVFAAFERALATGPLAGNEVLLDQYSCFGRCQRGVNVLVRELLPSDNLAMLKLMPTAGGRATLYHRVEGRDAGRIVAEHVVGGRPIDEIKERK